MNKKIFGSLLLTVTILLSTSSQVFGLTADYTTTRLGGQDRFDTAIEVSKEFAKGDTITNCIIGNCDNFADNISATPLSVYKNAPILLTEKDTLNPKTEQRLVDMGIKNVFIVGGIGVVSQSVEDQLKSLGYNITRLSGIDRMATNRAIMNFIPKDLWGPHVKIINSYDWVEGLSVAADDKTVFLGKTYINPIFTISPNASAVADVQDIIDATQFLKDKWAAIGRSVDNAPMEYYPTYSFDVDGNLFNNSFVATMKKGNEDYAKGIRGSISPEDAKIIIETSISYSIRNEYELKTISLLDRYKGQDYIGSYENSAINEFYANSTINKRMADNHVYSSILLAKHDDFIDALSVAPLSAKYGIPLVLFNSSLTIPVIYSNTTSNNQVYQGVNKVYYIGGSAVISDGSESITK